MAYVAVPSIYILNAVLKIRSPPLLLSLCFINPLRAFVPRPRANGTQLDVRFCSFVVIWLDYTVDEVSGIGT